MANSYTTIPELQYVAQITGVNLRGIATKDKIQQQVTGDGGYIINLQDSTEGSGTHWCCFFIQDGYGVYFDSYGGPPPQVVCGILRRRAPRGSTWSNEIVQNLRSGYCGQYCIYFLWWVQNSRNSDTYRNSLTLKERLRSFLRQWSKDPEENLTILRKKFLNKLKMTRGDGVGGSGLTEYGRQQILRGQVLAGNDSPLILEELKSLNK